MIDIRQEILSPHHLIKLNYNWLGLWFNQGFVPWEGIDICSIT